MLEKGEKSATAQKHDWDRSGEDGKAVETADELKGEKSVAIAMGELRTVADFCLLY